MSIKGGRANLQVHTEKLLKLYELISTQCIRGMHPNRVSVHTSSVVFTAFLPSSAKKTLWLLAAVSAQRIPLFTPSVVQQLTKLSRRTNLAKGHRAATPSLTAL